MNALQSNVITPYHDEKTIVLSVLLSIKLGQKEPGVVYAAKWVVYAVKWIMYAAKKLVAPDSTYFY